MSGRGGRCPGYWPGTWSREGWGGPTWKPPITPCSALYLDKVNPLNGVSTHHQRVVVPVQQRHNVHRVPVADARKVQNSMYRLIL